MTIGTPVDQGHNQTASGTTVNVTTNQDIAFGDLIRVYHYANNGAATILGAGGIIDPVGSNYTVQFSNTTAPVAQLYAANALAPIPAGSTITVKFSGVANRHAISITSCSGALVPRDVVTNSSSTTNTASGTLTYPTLVQNEELLCAMIATAAAPGAVTWDQSFTAVGGNTATAFALPAEKVVTDGSSGTVTPSWVNSILFRTIGCSFPAGTFVLPSGATAGVKSKNKGKRVWRVMLPDGKIVICDSPTEYYNLLTRAVNEPEPSVAEPVSTVAETLEIAAEPERPKQPLLKLRPAEKREALNWAAAENMAVNLRALADSIRAARTPIADNDDDEAAELLRWVI